MKNRIHILVALLFLSFTANANPPFAPVPKVMTQKYGFSFAGGPVLSFFKIDTRESEKAHMLPGFSGECRLQFYPAANVHLQIGLEVMTQACRFNTYYFAPGYSQFYDLNYAYTHTLRTLELYIPLTCRIGFAGNESNARSIFYILGGYSPKIILGANTTITEKETGKGVWGGATQLDYEHHFLGLQEGNCLVAGMGLDRRLGLQEKFFSYEIIFRYNLSRFNYKGRIGLENTNDLMIKNCCINFQFGYRFQ
jgi:hypothetical protein